MKPEVMWCQRSKPNGWRFPPVIARFLQEQIAGASVLHLFGGLADFGIRIDIDPIVRPDVIADAWMPPFLDKSFDWIILDPPYVALSGQQRWRLLTIANSLARLKVVWFHTIWLDSTARLILEKAWLVRTGNNQHVRCLEFFRPSSEIRKLRGFMRGPQIKYNRWIYQPQGLPLQPAEEVTV